MVCIGAHRATAGPTDELVCSCRNEGHEVTTDSTHDRSTARRGPRLATLAAGALVAAAALPMLACGAGSTTAAGAGSTTAAVRHDERAKYDGRTKVPPELFGVQPGPTSIDA